MTKTRFRRSWSKDQKRTLVAEARQRLAAGEKFSAVVAALDVIDGSLRLWMRQFPEAAIQRVQIIDAIPERAGITLVTPNGFRFEDLDLLSAVELWRRIQ